MSARLVKTFLLPDLGEGLPDAEIVEWLVEVGAEVMLDQPLVAMETAKAVVEVPSPFSGRLIRRYGEKGEVIATGAPLADFELDLSKPQRAEAEATGHHAHPSPAPKPPAAAADAGSVVGAVAASDELRSERPVEAGGVKAVPAVRALARKLGVDLREVRGSGEGGVITLRDVREHASRRSRAAAPTPKSATAAPTPRPEPPATPPASGPSPIHLTPAQRRGIAHAPVGSAPSAAASAPWPFAEDRIEPLRGVRRQMARSMAEAHAQVVPTTIFDDADLGAWGEGQDLTARLIRALVTGCRAEPGLNAWFDAVRGERRLHARVDVGVAVDTPEGLFVVALRGCERRSLLELRAELDRLRQAVAARALPPGDLSGYTIMLSNFGKFAGRYATPVIVPPCVAILAAGRTRHDAVPVLGGFEARRILPLSLTFDHRALTGGEAARFLAAVLADLARPD
jgi:pyruvate dehydrogenase E2 component (dihydrolipoamide acetyltransferase)